MEGRENRFASERSLFQTTLRGVSFGTAGFTLLSLASAPHVHAYIGPGLGINAIMVALLSVGFLLSLLLLALWYPFKRLLRRWRAKPPPWTSAGR